MQFAKDSFFLALQQRLAGLNPQRTVTLNGTTVPAVVVAENLPPSSAAPSRMRFISSGVRRGGRRTRGQQRTDEPGVVISYYTLGIGAEHGGSRAVAGVSSMTNCWASASRRVPRRGTTRKRRARTWERRFSGIQPYSAKEKARGDSGGEFRFQSACRAALPRMLRATKMGAWSGRPGLTIYFFSEVTLS